MANGYTDYEAWQAETERRIFLLADMERLAGLIADFIKSGYSCFYPDGEKVDEPWQAFSRMIGNFYPPHECTTADLYAEFDKIFFHAETALDLDRTPILQSLARERNKAACDKIFIECALELKPEYIEGETWEAVEYEKQGKRKVKTVWKIISVDDESTLDNNWGKGYRDEREAVENYKKTIKIYKIFQKMPELYQYLYEHEPEFAAGNLSADNVSNWMDERGYFNGWRLERLFMLARPDGIIARRYIERG